MRQWLRALMRRYADFEKVTRDALRFTLDHLKVKYDAGVLESLFREYLRLRHYPEVPQGLQAFRPRKLAILSNGTPRMLEAVVRNAGLAPFFDDILSVEMVQTYKPDPEVYRLAVSRLGITKERMLFVSSNGWDVAGAKAFGFLAAWVNRQGHPEEILGIEPDYVVSDLLELADRVGQN
ncbi:MAG: haloacid dehalogenase type II [Alicyclobacillaceae bacterium]|nr:haloacid dehalogenase type II [Alicyclobacillaceae bacterium]